MGLNLARYDVQGRHYEFNRSQTTGRRQPIHPFQNSIQSSRGGSQLRVQNVPTVQNRLGGMTVI